MSLETTLTDITARLRQGKFPNEQAISQGVVLRVFQELGWDTWDTTVVWPEYQTGEGRADFERCSQHPDAQGRKRRYLARTPEELYPDREDLRDMRETLPGGWLVATNLNNVLKKTIIRLAAEVAGLKFGKDVAVEF